MVTFRKPNIADDGPEGIVRPVVITVWFTKKGTVCLYLESDHLNSGPTHLLRPNGGGGDFELLERIFESPRAQNQTEKGLNHLTEDLINDFEDTFYLFDKSGDGDIITNELGTVSIGAI